jgi:periplasmic protein TonB
MFDIITGQAAHIPRRPALPLLASVAAQTAVVGVVFVASAMLFTDALPVVPDMMAFVAAPPPPPPPPPPAARATPRRPQPDRTMAAAIVPTPLSAPDTVEPARGDEGEGFGVEGGVEGGVPGGVVGGVVGGLPDAPPPPPPPTPEAPRAPVRVGGRIEPPALVHRVEPEYPRAAVAAHIEGRVILEAIVDENGRVTDVQVLRSAGSILDHEAITALRQWRYAPLTLNGINVRFALTVTLSFSLAQAAS